MRRGSALLVGGMALALAVLSTASAVSAEVTVSPAFTVLYVKGDDGPNQIAVECLNGVVTVNQVPAVNGQVSCDDLEKLRVFGFGGDDTISLSGFSVSLGQAINSGLDGYGNQPSFAVYGGDGNDVLIGNATAEEFNGGAGNDVLSAPGALAAFMTGGPGNDRLFGKSLLVDFMLGGSGTDRIGASGARLSFGIGGSGADTIVGGGHTDIEVGGNGADKLAGKAGHDLLEGGPGPDLMFGGPGSDTLAGGSGRDRVHGGPGRDKQFEGGLPHGKAGHLPGLSVLTQIVSSGSGDAFAPLKRFAR